MAAIPTADILYSKTIPLKGNLQLFIADIANQGTTDRHVPAAVSRFDHVVWVAATGNVTTAASVPVCSNAQGTSIDLSYGDANYSPGDIALRASTGTLHVRLLAIGLRRS